jgi:ferrous iron transport protein A
MVPIGLMRTGSTVIIKDICGGRHMRRQLLDQGLIPGSLIRIIRNDACGPMTISINDTRLAIGRGVSLKIMGEEIAGGR